MIAATCKFSFLWPRCHSRRCAGEPCRRFLFIFPPDVLERHVLNKLPCKETVFIFGEGKVNGWTGSLLEEQEQTWQLKWFVFAFTLLVHSCVCALCSGGDSISIVWYMKQAGLFGEFVNEDDWIFSQKQYLAATSSCSVQKNKNTNAICFHYSFQNKGWTEARVPPHSSVNKVSKSWKLLDIRY